MNKNLCNSWKNIANLTKYSVLGQHKDVITSILISSNNEFILSSSKDSTVKMFSVKEEKQIRSFHLSCVGISSCALLPDDNIIVVGTFDDQM